MLTYNPQLCRYELKGDSLLMANAGDCGFYFDAEIEPEGGMYTHNALLAASFAHLVDPKDSAQFDRDLTEAKRVYHNSFARHADGYNPIHPLKMEYFNYQKVSIARAKEVGRMLLGDEMGIGKTVQAIGYINNSQEINYVLIVCTNSIKYNWKNELDKWLVRPMAYQVASPEYYPIGAQIVIINYEGLKKFQTPLRSKHWDLIIFDEVHNIKNRKSQRGEIAYTLSGTNILALSGTPLPNKVSELWPICHFLNPQHFPSEREFERCFQDRPEMLQLALRSSVLVRRLKSEVLPELPPKIRTVIELPAHGLEHLVNEELEIFAKQFSILKQIKEATEQAKLKHDKAGYEEIVKKLKADRAFALDEIARMKLEVGVAKVPYIITFLKEQMASVDKLIVFTHHREVAQKLHDAFGSIAVTHLGRDTPEQREENVKRFQTEPGIKLLIGALKTGVGYNATAAQAVVMAEIEWVPHVLSQAEDRAHRYGQKDTVNVWIPVLSGSLDAKMINKIVEKQELIDRALDNGKQII